MSLERPGWVGLAVGVIGAAIGELVWSPAGIALTFAAFVLLFVQIRRINHLTTRLIFLSLCALHGFVIWRATQNPLLGAVPIAGGVFMPPYETSVRRTGYLAGFAFG